ncbi:MAG: hypothetical protein BGP20_09980 [Thiobacillus sp. 63-78]|nr:MAG: hypothetical protein BGP20_09980 [Thiobacillus sp. 63-78]
MQQRPAQQVQRLPGQQVQRLPEPAQLPEPARQLQEPEQPQQALRREQPLLLFCRKRSWKQPAEQPGERNISFDFPLLRI